VNEIFSIGGGPLPSHVYAMGGGELQVLQGWHKEISLAFCPVCDTCRGAGYSKFDLAFLDNITEAY
jgi:hypothetical protein